MQRIDELLSSNNILDSIAKCTTYGEIGESDTRATIKGLHMMFQKLKKTPDMIRLMLQMEFEFDGVVNACSKGVDIETLLSCDWYDSTFVVPQYSCVKKWVKKCIEENQKGKTVVMIIPSRTNTDWFHELIVPSATDVRFIRGRITLPGYTKQNQYPDAVCIFSAKGSSSSLSAPPLSLVVPNRNVAILACNTSFTSDEIQFTKKQKP
jgi:site-specific DNA-methyltransferase (adenine-specific)